MLRKLYQGIALSSSRKLSEGSADPDGRPSSSKAQVQAEQPDEAAKCAADAHQEVDGSRPASLDAFRKSLKTGIKEASNDSAYNSQGLGGPGKSGSSGGPSGSESGRPISDDSAYTSQQASLSLLSAGPRMSRGSAAFSPLGGSGSGQPPGSRQSPATTSDRPDTGASNAGSGARPSTSRQQPLQSSLDSARHGGSWQSLQSVRTDPSDGADAMTPHRSEQEGIAEAGRQASRLTPEQQQQQAGQAQPREQRQAQPPAEPEQDPAAGSGIGPADASRRSGQGPRTLSPHNSRNRGPSQESAGSAGPESSSRSQRSSFARERASVDGNRASLEMFQAMAPPPAQVEAVPVSYEDMELMCDQLGIPKAMRDRYLKLAVVPDNTPLPMTMLVKLWRVSGEQDAEATANLMEQGGIMRVACLYDGSAWALVDSGHLKHLQGASWSSIPDVHADLLDDYMEGFEQLADVPDDGYIMQNAGHHLVGAKRLWDLKKLISSPSWLETKLHSYGVASVVADFRRFLMVRTDEEVKLLLEALQMSVSSCMQMPDMAMLRSQMLARLMTVPRLQEWCKTQLDLARQQAPGSQSVRCLLPRSPSLEQAGGLHRMVLRGHTGGIMKVLLTSGGIDVITASTDGTARVWDMEIGDCVLLLEGHQGPVTDLAASSDSSILVTASADQTARVWSLEKGQCTAVLAGHTGMLHGVAVDPHGCFAVTASADGTARVWDLGSGQCAHVLAGHSNSATGTGVVWAVALTPDGRQALTASEDFTARVWDVMSGTCERVLEGHTGWVVGVAISPDGSHAVTASHDGTARTWHLATGQCTQLLQGHAGRLNAVKLSGSGTTAITVSDDYTARVWDWASGKCRHVLEGHGGWLSDVALVHNGSRAVTVSGDDLAVVWDLQAGACVNVLDGHSGEVSAVVLTRRGRFAVTGSQDSTARVWDLAAGPSKLEQGHNGRVHTVSVSPDGRTAASIGDDAKVLVWDCSTGKGVHTLQGHASGLRWCEIVDEGRRIVTVSGNRLINQWDLKTGERIQTFPSHQGSRVKSFNASADGSIAVIVLFDSTVAVWCLATMERRCVLQKWGDRDAARVHSGGVNAGYLTPDGRQAVTVSKDHTARIWDVATGNCTAILEGHTDGIFMGSLNDDGQLLLTSSFDQTCRVWDVEKGACLAQLQHSAQLKQGIITPDGTRAVTITGDNMAHLWDLSTGTEAHLLQKVLPFPVSLCSACLGSDSVHCAPPLQGHKDEIAHAAFSRDSEQLATCSSDCTLRVWSSETGQLEAFFHADCALSFCKFAPLDEKPDTVLTSGLNGVVHFLQLRDPSYPG